MLVRACACVGVHVHACACMCMCGRACACVCVHVHACAYVCVRVHACACVCMRVHACACVCMCVRACACVCVNSPSTRRLVAVFAQHRVLASLSGVLVHGKPDHRYFYAAGPHLKGDHALNLECIRRALVEHLKGSKFRDKLYIQVARCSQDTAKIQPRYS